MEVWHLVGERRGSPTYVAGTTRGPKRSKRLDQAARVVHRLTTVLTRGTGFPAAERAPARGTEKNLRRGGVTQRRHRVQKLTHLPVVGGLTSATDGASTAPLAPREAAWVVHDTAAILACGTGVPVGQRFPA